MFIKTFRQIDKKSVSIAGGKGASLGEMTQRGIRVPPGFVVLAVAFDRFLEETDLLQDIGAQLKKVNYNDTNSVSKTSAVIRNMIAKTEFPEDLGEEITNAYHKLFARNKGSTSPSAGWRISPRQERGMLVAVRSSATAEDSKVASWAGELETYLNTTKKDLLKNVKKCWSSLFTPRAIFYRKEKNLHKAKVSVAVVVQEMVQSEISGITFTVHPVIQDKNQMIIEAGYGLGEAIVSGSITPDSYVIDKKNQVIMDINVANQGTMLVRASRGNKTIKVKKTASSKQKLAGKQILELATLCARVEKHYGFPCDIEWAYARGKFYITQSRPITTL